MQAASAASPSRARLTASTTLWAGTATSTATAADEKQVMKLVRNQKGVVQDCAVVLFGLCEACAGKQAQ